MNNTTKPVLTLKQFMLRQQVLSLYRRILKTIKQVPVQDQNELKERARTEFKSNAHHTEEITIKMMITYGERTLKQLQTTIALAK